MFQRSRTARKPLRLTIVRALQRMKPRLEEEQAFVHAEVIVQLIKGELTLYREAPPKQREAMVEEFKKVMRLYVMEVVGDEG